MKYNTINKMSGQAFPVGIALFFILGVTSFVLFNTGQTVTDKTRIVNTADSAAYSGLLWQARAMNFTAYTNRAMVANQVAMAQAVSLNSWSAYLNQSAENLDTAVGWVPYVGVVTGIVAAIASGLDAFLTPISQGMLTVINSINKGVSLAQESMYFATFAATPDVVHSVVKSNDVKNQNFKWETAFSLMNTGSNLNKWRTLTEKFDETHPEAMLERKHMVNASLDRFSKERNWKFFGFFIPITPVNWVRLEKHGTTILEEQDGEWEWHGSDALSLREKRYTWRGKKYKDLPIGGGSAIANTQDSWESITGERHNFFGRRHGKAKYRAEKPSGAPVWTHDGRSMNNYDGMHAFRSLSKEWRDGDEPPVLKLRIEVSIDPSDISSADELTSAKFASTIDTPGNVITSISAAELFFERPCINNSCGTTEEYADGYSPYWDVRLAKNSAVARLAAYALHGSTITDSNGHFEESKLHDLPRYHGRLANPIDDYKEQYKGVRRVISSMDRHLLTLAMDSEAYREYEQRLNTIKDSINMEVEDIVDDFIQDQIPEGELLEDLAKAAGFDLDVNEFKAFKGEVTDLYEDMTNIGSLNDIKSQLGDVAQETADQLKEDIKAALEEQLRDAVKNILSGLAVAALESASGVDVNDAVVEGIVNEQVDDILDTEVDSRHEDDVQIDLSDECAVHTAINNAEVQVQDMQIRLEEVNQKIADEFHAELIRVSGETTDRRIELQQERANIAALISNLQRIENPYVSRFEHREDYNQRLRDIQREKQIIIDGLSDVRVETLIASLQTISDRHTSTLAEFQDFRLEYQFARKAVLDTIGDIDDWEIDENGETVAQNMFFAESENEIASDREQTFTERPDNC